MLSAASARTPSSSGKRGWPGGGATFGAGSLTVAAAYGRGTVRPRAKREAPRLGVRGPPEAAARRLRAPRWTSPRPCPRTRPPPTGRRSRAATCGAAIVRGTLINAVALAGVDLLVLAQGLIATRLLGPTAIGLYGIVTVTTMTVVGLKRVGVDEAFVAQDEPEQALEFQRAFTLELAISAVFSLILCALAPVSRRSTATRGCSR